MPQQDDAYHDAHLMPGQQQHYPPHPHHPSSLHHHQPIVPLQQPPPQAHQQQLQQQQQAAAQQQQMQQLQQMECKRNLQKMLGISPSDIDKYSRIFFPISFTCFNLMYWIIYLHVSDELAEDLVMLQKE